MDGKEGGRSAKHPVDTFGYVIKKQLWVVIYASNLLIKAHQQWQSFCTSSHVSHGADKQPFIKVQLHYIHGVLPCLNVTTLCSNKTDLNSSEQCPV